MKVVNQGRMIRLAALLSGALVSVTSARVIDMVPHWNDEIALTNPHKGWYHHYLDNGLKKYLVLIAKRKAVKSL